MKWVGAVVLASASAVGAGERVVVRAGTVNAARLLGLEAEVGTLAADLVAVDGDPLRDVRALGRLCFVMKGGRVVKNEYGP